MIDIYNMKFETSKILKSISVLKKVSTDYPSSWNTFPIAIYRTSRSPHFIDAFQQELQSYWQITVEVYGDSKTGNLTNIVKEIMEQFNIIGFQGDAKDANTAGLNRVICVFSAIVDNVTRQVSKK
ncbi:hypothetical protein [Enterococcus caccae]|uniref:Uncharacterized protein n=1 Tax=Enterococcus caccae ATCC BAA-1240 TaxID=1158612 RepID=R3TW30_9ENTE|nr:hypothetical protein [Enterococcus caccae]EOL45819.1 hypothetical protein UC7_01616 [Enterococcus caccae ATCC BAA-1240]EOT61015.1 hypothetical protein I580_01917 [Enterococcus caccae ATCC BAA-1240]OJG27955.1 hypothetical protein RU98_GL002164 [Enterococcus caccae]